MSTGLRGPQNGRISFSRRCASSGIGCHVEPALGGHVGHQRADAARHRQQPEPATLRRRCRQRTGVGDVEEFVDAARAVHAVLPEQPVVDLIRPGQRGGVRRRRLRTGFRAADLHDDDALAVVARQFQRGDQPGLVGGGLDVADDDLGALVLREMADAVREVDIALVAGGDPQVQAQAALADQRQAIAAESTALADQADAAWHQPEARGAGREGAQDAALHIDHAHAVGADDAHAGAARERADAELPFGPLTADLGKARTEHHRSADALGGAVLERGQHRRRRHRDDGQVDRPRHRRHGGKRRQALDHGRLRVDGVERPVEAAALQEVERPSADLGGVGRCTVDRDGTRVEQRAQRCTRGLGGAAHARLQWIDMPPSAPMSWPVT
jgi:hypothetical protein